MKALTLSPTLFDICDRSGSFRRHRYYGTLNVCNVIRSMMFVLLFWDVIIPGLLMLALDSVVKVPFVMAYTLNLNPFDALDLISDVTTRKADFVWTNFSHWWSVTSFMIAALLTIVGTVAVCGGVLCLGVFFAWLGLKRFFQWEPTMDTLTKVVGPIEIVAEYVASKHSKFCRNIENVVEYKTTYAEELRNQMEAQLSKHWNHVRRMSKDELLASIEKNRAILANWSC